MTGFNIVEDTDSYKASQWLQYPHGTTYMQSFIESRGGKYARTCYVGPQIFLKQKLTQRVTTGDVIEAAKFYKAHGVPFNYDGWMTIATKHEGRLPVRIRSVAEGSVVPTRNVLMTIESTDPEVFWIAGWLETALLRSVWYPTNVATLSFHIKEDILRALYKTSDNPEAEIPFKLHDFGSRGVSSQESAGIGGMAHLVNFMGSDTVVGVLTANRYYNSEMAAYSIPASEHSTITSWGRDYETAAYANLLDNFAKPGAILACVSDSYDIYNACEKLWGGELRQRVIDSGATLVVRPDSGTPWEVVPEVLKRLDSKFGHMVNSKGYRVLNHVRVIQGDGVNHESINKILDVIVQAGYSATNLAFGMGGALLQGHDRDTQRFAMKCSSVIVDGKERDVFKDPVTDIGKKSKAGRLDLIRNTGWSDKGISGYETIKLAAGQTQHPDSVLETVFENGEILKEYTLDEVRANAATALHV